MAEFFQETRMTIVVVGSINTDLTIRVPHFAVANETVLGDGDFTTTQGGKGANQAVAAAAAGLPVHIIGKVGRDAFGDAAIEDLQSSGIDCGHVVREADHATGLATIFVDADGNNSITVAPGANARITPEDVQSAAELIAAASIVMLQLEIPLAAVTETIHLANQHGTMVMLDPAPATIAMPELSGVDYLTPNEIEAEALTGIATTDDNGPQRIITKLRERGAKQIVLTLGRLGCCISNDDETTFIQARPVQALDTTGAGDAFNGFLATGLVKGLAVAKAAEIAGAAATLSVTRAGARANLPTWDEVQAFLGA
jgi:ribokinase